MVAERPVKETLLYRVCFSFIEQEERGFTTDWLEQARMEMCHLER